MAEEIDGCEWWDVSISWDEEHWSSPRRMVAGWGLDTVEGAICEYLEHVSPCVGEGNQTNVSARVTDSKGEASRWEARVGYCCNNCGEGWVGDLERVEE
jgi:hypothetical protein